MDYFSTHRWFRQRAVHSCGIGKTLRLGKFPQLSSQTHIRRLKVLRPYLWRRHLTTSCNKCVHIMQLKTSASSAKLSFWTQRLFFWMKFKLKPWREEGFPLLLRPATRGPEEHFGVRSAFHAKSTGIKIPFPQSLWKAIIPSVPLQRGGGLLQVPSGKHLLSLAPCITYLMNEFIDMVLLWIKRNRSRKTPKLPVITREIEHALVWSFCPPHCQRPQGSRDGTHLSCTKNHTPETWSRSYFSKWLTRGGYDSHYTHANRPDRTASTLPWRRTLFSEGLTLKACTPAHRRGSQLPRPRTHALMPAHQSHRWWEVDRRLLREQVMTLRNRGSSIAAPRRIVQIMQRRISPFLHVALENKASCRSTKRARVEAISPLSEVSYMSPGTQLGLGWT